MRASASLVTAAVFAGARPAVPESLRRGLASGVTLAACAALVAWAVLAPPHRRAHRPASAPETAVELYDLPPPPPPPPPAEPPPPPPRAPPEARLPPPPASAEPSPTAPAPAQAAEVLTREAAPDEPVDLGDVTIASGHAARFAGGTTAANGTSTEAVAGLAVAGGARAGSGAAGPDLSRPVGIDDTEWSDCAWPAEADALGIDRQVVSMRAVARTDGSVESAEVLGDPGNGFGPTLLDCARRHGLTPALDRQGRPVRARSGVLRFTFTRN